MSLKDKLWTAAAVVGMLAVILFLRGSSTGEIIAAFLRRKKTEDLAKKIEENVAIINSQVGFTEERLRHEAEVYRAQKLDESPEAIQLYYHNFFNRKFPNGS